MPFILVWAFELYYEGKKRVPEVSNSAYAGGGLMGSDYIINPEHNLIALFYLNMYQREPLYPEFLSKAYRLFEECNELRGTAPRVRIS